MWPRTRCILRRARRSSTTWKTGATSPFPRCTPERQFARMTPANASGPPTLFLNRELSWLEFDARVLAEAFDERNPLLERLKFLSIFSTNLDEFYMVRVAGLRRQVAARVQLTAPDGLTAREQLDAIERRVGDLLEQARRCLHELLLPSLAAHGVRLLAMAELGAAEGGA